MYLSSMSNSVTKHQQKFSDLTVNDAVVKYKTFNKWHNLALISDNSYDIICSKILAFQNKGRPVPVVYKIAVAELLQVYEGIK